MDEGKVTPDSFAVLYTQEKWWDAPEIRHSNGQVFSFVDNHAELWKWSQETITLGLAALNGSYNSSAQNYAPTTNNGKQDLYKIQLSCWGNLGYNPSVQPNVY